MPFCINCDNRHGCKTGKPACLRMEREPGEQGLRGRELMARRGLLTRCQNCKDLLRCWPRQEYQDALEKERREGNARSEAPPPRPRPA